MNSLVLDTRYLRLRHVELDDIREGLPGCGAVTSVGRYIFLQITDAIGHRNGCGRSLTR